MAAGKDGVLAHLSPNTGTDKKKFLHQCFGEKFGFIDVTDVSKIFGMKMRQDIFIGHYQIKHWQRKKKKCKGGKKAKERVTVAFFVNAAGGKEFIPIVIGRACVLNMSTCFTSSDTGQWREELRAMACEVPSAKRMEIKSEHSEDEDEYEQLEPAISISNDLLCFVSQNRMEDSAERLTYVAASLQAAEVQKQNQSSILQYFSTS